jgi:triosephosphate isomerase
MRNRIVAGNWKMNKTFSDAEELIVDIADGIEDLGLDGKNVVICPPSVYLELATDIAEETGMSIGAQNIYPADSGAFTGEISPAMLKELQVKYCIIGHSERRQYFGESDEFLRLKADALLKHGIIPIFCCGEILVQRQEEIHFEVVKTQLESALFHLPEVDFRKVVIAYEPVWAIGTGVTATPEQAQEMHAFIRNVIALHYGQSVADDTTILYGGSCNAKNAADLFSRPDVDGGLIGGASLVADDFLQIVSAL